MKNSFYLLLTVILFSAIFFSCNKDDTVSPGGGNTVTGPVTQTYSSNPDKQIAPNDWTMDSLNANISFGINASSVSDIKLNLNTLNDVVMSNLKFVLFHNGTEVLVIDNLTSLTTTGNITNAVLSDSSSNPIMNVNSYPITGVYRPMNPLSDFDNSEAGGYWTLRIYNSGSLRTGVIKSWGITITFNVVQPPSTLQIFPAAIENTWKLEGRSASGNIYGYDTLRISEKILNQGKTMYRVIDYDNPDTMYVYNENDGAYIWSKFGGSTFGSQLMWKYPIIVGEIYIGGGNGDTVKCLSINETITTPSGTYTGCIKYEIHDLGQIKTYFYMKPGLGIIGIDHLQNGDYERLYSYHLNK